MAPCFAASAALTLLLHPAILAQDPIASAVIEVPSPMVRLADDPLDPVSTVSFRESAHRELAVLGNEEDVFLFRGVPLPQGRHVDLEMRLLRVMDEGGKAVVVAPDGAESRVSPSVVQFAGGVPGKEGAAFLALTGTMLNGFVRLGDELFFFSSGGPTRSGKATVASAALFPEVFGDDRFCEMLLPAGEGFSSSGGGGIAGGAAELRTADWFVECEPDYRNLFTTDQEAVDFALLLFGASSEIYRRDIGTRLEIPDGYLRIWNATPPWGDVDGYDGLYDFRDWWSSDKNPDRDIPRAGVHLLASPVFGGIAWVDVLCNKDYGYAVSSVNGYFPYPIEHTSTENWDLLVVSHELGHNFGSLHTFDYNPPIDCEDGSGPDKGTLMGYCHQNPGGVENVGMRFHQRVQDRMRQSTSAAGCLDVTVLDDGDYDANGILEASDLAALGSCLTQGFYSSGCHDVFDMNADGDLDFCDYALLEATILGTDIGMYANPLTVATGDPLELGACGGVPGKPVAMFLIAIDGALSWRLILVNAFDSEGERLAGGSLPPGLDGLQLTFQTFAHDAADDIVTSQEVDVQVQ